MASISIKLFNKKEVQTVNDLVINVIDNRISVPTIISLQDELGERVKKYSPISLVPILKPIITCTDSYVIPKNC